MEETPSEAGLLEFTLALETCPMVSLDPASLDSLQDAAVEVGHMYDPVFELDETKGSITVIFQVWAATAALAAALGCWLFFNTMVKTGFRVTQNDIEMIAVCKTADEKPAVVESPQYETEDANT